MHDDAIGEDGAAAVGEVADLGQMGPVGHVGEPPGSAKTVAIGSMPKPYDAADMVLAVVYLLGRL